MTDRTAQEYASCPTLQEAQSSDLTEVAKRIAWEHWMTSHPYDVSDDAEELWTRLNDGNRAGYLAAARAVQPQPSADVREALEVILDDMQVALDEAFGFASMSPAGQDNISFATDKIDEIRALLPPLAALSAAPSAGQEAPFQERVRQWVLACFGPEIAADKIERNHRFLEEALELVQACGCTGGEAHQLVDYVFGRPVGERRQEVGGTIMTLAALCLAQGIDMQAAGEAELSRVWTLVEKIRAKQASKPKGSPLPAAPAQGEAQTPPAAEGGR